MGGIADHLDPVEAQLVKRLSSELCKVNFTYQGTVIQTETVRATFVGVADIEDLGDDEGRVATTMIKGKQQYFTYNPVTAMAYCGYSSTKGGLVYYDRVSQTLIDRGGDPEIYRQRKIAHDAYTLSSRTLTEREGTPSLHHSPNTIDTQDAVYDLKSNIRIYWEGYDMPFSGSIREISSQSQGTFAVEFKGKGIGICTGSFQKLMGIIDPWRDAIWNVTCSSGDEASGTFRYTNTGSLGNGTDNKNRAVMFVVESLP